MIIEALKSTISDNYFYLVHDGESAALIDPIDPGVAFAAIERAAVRLDLVINTHWHPDHVGGNDAVLDRYSAATLWSGPDHELITSNHAVDHIVADGDDIEVGAVKLHVLETPGHTAGHISLAVDGHLFCGDTIFVGGAGNCRFGGDSSVLFRTYRDVLTQIPGATVFYPGHDYSVRNVEFALSLEPNHGPALKMLERLTQQHGELLLTTLDEERQYNPFFRYGAASLQAALRRDHAELWQREREVSETDDEATFRTTRELRNSW